MVERSRVWGAFLASLPRSALTSDRFDFINHGLYQPTFAEGKLTALKHWSVAGGTLSGYTTTTVAKFVLVDDHLGFAVTLAAGATRSRCIQSVQRGPH